MAFNYKVTELNSIVQVVGDASQEEFDSEVPNYLKSSTGKTKFQGIDREDMDKEMSEWIEILISKKDCSPYDAMKILNLTLAGLINETTGEGGIIYLYDDDSTHIATMINLAAAIAVIAVIKEITILAWVVILVLGIAFAVIGSYLDELFRFSPKFYKADGVDDIYLIE